MGILKKIVIKLKKVLHWFFVLDILPFIELPYRLSVWLNKGERLVCQRRYAADLRDWRYGVNEDKPGNRPNGGIPTSPHYQKIVHLYKSEPPLKGVFVKNGNKWPTARVGSSREVM